MSRPFLGALQVRSGRFETASETNIIEPSDMLRLYRFHNTAKTGTVKIKIVRGTSTPETDFDLEAGGSVDLLVTKQHHVTVGAGRGIYDWLLGSAAARSGAFTPANLVLAKLNAEKFIYRIINASESQILTVKSDASGFVDRIVAPKSSLDLVLTGTVSVEGTGAEGVFDVLGIEK